MESSKETPVIDTRAHLLAEFEKRKKARNIHVPTDDAEVRHQLRQLGQPITLFGEDPADRRDRLRMFLLELGPIAAKKLREDEAEQKRKAKEENITWYHKGSPLLKEARYWLVEYSLPRAKARLEASRAELQKEAEVDAAMRMQEMHKNLRSLTMESSQVGDSRPLSYCSFSSDSRLLATGSWSGLCKLWSVPDLQPVRTLRGHNTQVGAVVFHPNAAVGVNESGCCLASCAFDGTVKLWSMDSDEPLADIEGHAPYRVSRLAWHPSGRFLGTCCFDYSWRLWDLEAHQEILHQEGHSGPVYCLSFHPDGSLALSGGMDAYGRLWDLRTGCCIMFMEGHLKSVLACDFSPNGHIVVTASEDHSCKIWDIRYKKCTYTIPAHNNVVCSARFQPSDGRFLLTSSYDNSAKLWANYNWAPVTQLQGHENKILCVDIAPNLQYLCTASYDRTFKLWTTETRKL